MDFPILLIIIIALALIFDFINGFHDAANSIATIVSTKVLTPFQAVLWAAVWNFAAFFRSNSFETIVASFECGLRLSALVTPIKDIGTNAVKNNVKNLNFIIYTFSE